MAKVDKAIGRSEEFSLDLLRARLGRANLADLGRELVIRFGKERAEDGAGPVTVGIASGTFAPCWKSRRLGPNFSSTTLGGTGGNTGQRSGVLRTAIVPSVSAGLAPPQVHESVGSLRAL